MSGPKSVITIAPIVEEEFELPSGTEAGTIVFRVVGNGKGVYKWDVEVISHTGSAFWIQEGVGFDYWFNDVADLDLSVCAIDGLYAVDDVTVHWTRGDGWTTDDDERWEYGKLRLATEEEAGESSDRRVEAQLALALAVVSEARDLCKTQTSHLSPYIAAKCDRIREALKQFDAQSIEGLSNL